MKHSESEEAFVVSVPTVSPFLIVKYCGVLLIFGWMNLMLSWIYFLSVVVYGGILILMILFHNNKPALYVYKDTLRYQNVMLMHHDIECILCKKRKIKVISNGKVIARIESSYHHADQFILWAEEQQIPLRCS